MSTSPALEEKPVVGDQRKPSMWTSTLPYGQAGAAGFPPFAVRIRWLASAMRILLVRLGAFGDIVHTLPLAHDLAQAGHEVHWLCEDRWACLVDGSAAVAMVHRLPRAELRRASLTGKIAIVRRVLRSLRQHDFDAAIDAQGLAKSAIFSAFSGTNQVVGHARPRARELSWLAHRIHVPATAIHVIDQQRALGLGLGVRAQGGWHFPLPAWTHEHLWANKWMEQNGLQQPWLLNVGAGWPTKVWPEARQAEFLARCRSQGRQVVVAWGSPAERAVAERVSTSARHGVLLPPTTIPELGAVLARAGLVVSGDTGPLHLALALGTPAVGLFGPVPAERNGPRGRRWRCLQAPGAAWERRDVSKVDMAAITAEAVESAALACLADA